MKRAKWIQRAAVIAATVSMVIAQPLMAASIQAPVNVVSDIGLSTGGLLQGKVVDPQGAPIQQASVVVLHDGQEVARTTTTTDGLFRVAGLRSGVHQVVGESGVATCRFWAEGTSPPAANQAALIVSGDPLVRGQGYGCAPSCAPACPPRCAPACAPTCDPPCGPACGPSCGPCGGCCIRPGQLLLLGGIAAAIAIPIAVSDSGSGS